MIDDVPPRLNDRAANAGDTTLSRRRYVLPKDEFRDAFHRDYTRIIHSKAFRRLHHKAQVFITPKNDHVCTRLEHSIHVASISDTIARALGLNCDLARAIAVGHDLGHAPFGHKGENALKAILKDHKISFSHELQGLRVVDFLDSSYEEHPGLNLTFGTRDGIVCHYGERFEKELCPNRAKCAATITLP